MSKRYFTAEVKIALTAIIALVLLFIGFNFLKGINVFKTSNNYYIEFSDILGLATSSPVYANGYAVGTVREEKSRPRSYQHRQDRHHVGMYVQTLEQQSPPIADRPCPDAIQPLFGVVGFVGCFYMLFIHGKCCLKVCHRPFAGSAFANLDNRPASPPSVARRHQ